MEKTRRGKGGGLEQGPPTHQGKPGNYAAGTHRKPIPTLNKGTTPAPPTTPPPLFAKQGNKSAPVDFGEEHDAGHIGAHAKAGEEESRKDGPGEPGVLLLEDLGLKGAHARDLNLGRRKVVCAEGEGGVGSEGSGGW